MNLVIDDAVEVKLANKTKEETRRNLGQFQITRSRQTHATNLAQDKSYSRATTFLSSRA